MRPSPLWLLLFIDMINVKIFVILRIIIIVSQATHIMHNFHTSLKCQVIILIWLTAAITSLLGIMNAMRTAVVTLTLIIATTDLLVRHLLEIHLLVTHMFDLLIIMAIMKINIATK